MRGLAPFVGRASEFAAVTEALVGSARAVVVMGDAGVGKTRLVSEAAKAVEAKGVIVVAGRCLALSAGLPLLPILDMLRALHEVNDGRLWADILAASAPSVRQALSRLLSEPEHRADSAVAIHGGSAFEQARLFDALRQILKTAGQRNVALLVEDVHWADDGTRDLLEYLLGAADTVPLPMVLTCRSQETTSPETSDWLDRLPRLVTVSFLPLEPLDRADAVTHVHALAGGRVTALDVDSIVRRSEGNAFFLEQLVRFVLQDEGGQAAGLPMELTSLLMARLRKVDGLPSDVLACLAIAGDSKDEDFLVRCCARSVPEMRKALRELSRRHLLRAGTKSDEFQLAHALLGEAIAGRLLAGERREWHERVALALEGRGATAQAGPIADHYRLADRPADELRWRVLAARQADARYAPLQSSIHWQRAVALSEAVGRPDLPDHLSQPAMYLATARALYRSGEGDAAVALVRSALEIFGNDADDGTRAALLAGLGAYCARREPVAAEENLRESVRMYEGLSPDVGYLDAAYDYVDCILHSRRLRIVATATNERALAAASALDAPDQQLKLLLQRAWLDVANGDEKQGLTRVAEARRMVAKHESPYAALQFAAWVTDILLKVGRPADVPEVAELTGMARWTTFASRESELMSVLRANVCQARLQLGETALAAQVIDPVITSDRTRDMWLTHAYRAALDMLRGQLDASSQRWRQLPRTGEGQDDYENEPARAELELWLRHPERALEQIIAILRDRSEAGETRFTGPLLLVAVRAYAEMCEQNLAASGERESEGSSHLGRQLTALHDEMAEDPFVPGPLRPTAAADALLWESEWTRAEGASDQALWEAAADAYARYPRPHLAAYARWRHAQALLATGARAREVAPVLRLAARDAHGHEPLLGEIRRLAERARVNLDTPETTTAPAPPTPFGLTNREVTVLRMVARGDTNSQIGRELFISEKTASVHVSNILRKLQVTNRLQAAAVAEGAGLLADDHGTDRDTSARTVSSSG